MLGMTLMWHLLLSAQYCDVSQHGWQHHASMFPDLEAQPIRRHFMCHKHQKPRPWLCLSCIFCLDMIHF